MKISILIPVKGDNKNLRECVENCLRLDYPDFEIIVLTDGPADLPYGDRVRVIPTGPVGPAKKRDLAADKTKDGILAFLDDDTYPREDWLRNAAGDFKNDDVAAVCGPAVTPASDSLGQKASGFVYSSFLVSGGLSMRYAPAFMREVDDYPSCNFLIRKDVFKAVGGFNTNFWPGEDTILCLKITRELRKKIIYDPRVLVYHHRRPLFGPHLRQIKSYALHRGYFVKKFPETSFRPAYFIPGIFVLELAAGAVFSVFIPVISFPYLVVNFLYLVLVFIYSVKYDGLSLKFLVFSGSVLTHLTYGVYFIKGLFSKRLAEE